VSDEHDDVTDSPANSDTGDTVDAGETQVELDDVQEFEPIDTTNPDVIGTARRRYGGAGVLLAAGMLGLDKILTEKKKTESVQVQEASSDPGDVDSEGILVAIDPSLAVQAPALERKAPLTMKKKPRR